MVVSTRAQFAPECLWRICRVHAACVEFVFRVGRVDSDLYLSNTNWTLLAFGSSFSVGASLLASADLAKKKVARISWIHLLHVDFPSDSPSYVHADLHPLSQVKFCINPKHGNPQLRDSQRAFTHQNLQLRPRRCESCTSRRPRMKLASTEEG